MSEQETTTQEHQAAGFDIGFIWFVLFRRARLVLAFALIGFLAAGAVYLLKKPVYRSTFSVMVDSVANKMVGPNDPGRPTFRDPEALLNAEATILGSYDLCEKVARGIGPEKLAPGVPAEARLDDAAQSIKKTLHIEVQPKNIIIEVGYEHPDASVVQPVLQHLLQRYFERHHELHAFLGGSESNLLALKVQVEARLREIEAQLRGVRTQALVVSSIEETRKGYTTQIVKLQSDLMEAESKWEEQKVLFGANNPEKPTNAAPVSLDGHVPEDIILEYKRVTYELEALRAKELEFLTKNLFTTEHPSVKNIRELIAQAQARQKMLLKEHPKLEAVNMPAAVATAPGATIFQEMDKREAYAAKVRVLKQFLSLVQSNSMVLDQLESQIVDLQRQRELEDSQLKKINTALQEKRYDLILPAGAPRSDNISVVQTPTPATRIASKRLKFMGMVFAGCFAAGLGLAFVLEIFVDRTVKRPSEIEPRLKLPLLMAVPDIQDRPRLPAPGGADPGRQLVPLHGAIPPWSPNHFLRPYADALCNRVGMYFEFVKRKPKLVGLTSCSDGAGTSSMVAGLAAALSESGDCRVLVVDVNRGRGVSQTFFRGEPINDPEELSKEPSVVNPDNHAPGNSTGEGSHRTLPASLRYLLPKLNSNEYEYVIFDMPKVSMASVSLRLSTFLDLTLVMVESEKVQNDVLKKSCAMLTESGAKVGVVMNKVHTYVPEWLHTEV